MLRMLLLFTVVLATALYAWRDWFKANCVLILLMTVLEHPDMPKSMLGIPGLNPWNLLLFDVIAAWIAARRREGLKWDMPRSFALSLLAFLVLVTVGVIRLLMDPANLNDDFSPLGRFMAYYFNTVKFTIPGLLLFDGCRTRSRFIFGLCATLGVYALLAIQVIRWVPPSADSAELERRSRKVLRAEVGYYRVDLSTMLAGASWAILAAAPLARRASVRIAIKVMAVAVVYGQALTAGRSGYVAFVAVGLVLCLLRWRRYLLAAPFLTAAVLALAPGIVGRATTGFGGGDAFEESGIDEDELSAGRTEIWPLIIDKIRGRPIVGYGRDGFYRTGLGLPIPGLAEPWGNPHSAYLEFLLDNGILGLGLVMLFYGLVMWHGLRLFMDGRNAVFIAAGGAASALVLAQLVAGVAGQTLYPREGTVGMWCAVGLLIRVVVERREASRLIAAGTRQT